VIGASYGYAVLWANDDAQSGTSGGQWLVALDGSEHSAARALRLNGESAGAVTLRLGWLHAPVFSADGQWLLARSDAGWGLMPTAASTTEQAVILAPLSSLGAYAYRSSDGSWLLVEDSGFHRVPLTPEAARLTGTVPLTPTDQGLRPTLAGKSLIAGCSSAGTRLLFGARVDGTESIFSARTDGSDADRWVNVLGDEVQAELDAISPLGGRLLYRRLDLPARPLYQRSTKLHADPIAITQDTDTIERFIDWVQ